MAANPFNFDDPNAKANFAQAMQGPVATNGGMTDAQLTALSQQPGYADNPAVMDSIRNNVMQSRQDYAAESKRLADLQAAEIKNIQAEPIQPFERPGQSQDVLPQGPATKTDTQGNDNPPALITGDRKQYAEDIKSLMKAPPGSSVPEQEGKQGQLDSAVVDSPQSRLKTSTEKLHNAIVDYSTKKARLSLSEMEDSLNQSYQAGNTELTQAYDESAQAHRDAASVAGDIATDTNSRRVALEAEKNAYQQKFNEADQKSQQILAKQEATVQASEAFQMAAREQLGAQLDVLREQNKEINTAFNSDRTLGRVTAIVGTLIQGIIPIYASKIRGKEKYQKTMAAGAGLGGAIASIGTMIDQDISQGQKDVLNKIQARAWTSREEQENVLTQAKTFMNDAQQQHMLRAAYWDQVGSYADRITTLHGIDQADSQFQSLRQTMVDKKAEHIDLAVNAQVSKVKTDIDLKTKQVIEKKQEMARRQAAALAAEKRAEDIQLGKHSIVKDPRTGLPVRVSELQGKEADQARTLEQTTIKNANNPAAQKLIQERNETAEQVAQLKHAESVLADYGSRNTYLPGETPVVGGARFGFTLTQQESEIRSIMQNAALLKGQLMKGSQSDRDAAKAMEAAIAEGSVETLRKSIVEGRRLLEARYKE